MHKPFFISRGRTLLPWCPDWWQVASCLIIQMGVTTHTTEQVFVFSWLVQSCTVPCQGLPAYCMRAAWCKGKQRHNHSPAVGRLVSALNCKGLQDVAQCLSDQLPWIQELRQAASNLSFGAPREATMFCKKANQSPYSVLLRPSQKLPALPIKRAG